MMALLPAVLADVPDGVYRPLALDPRPVLGRAAFLERTTPHPRLLPVKEPVQARISELARATLSVQ
jgi:hypothetical protein